jgi:hypothetical protein
VRPSFLDRRSEFDPTTNFPNRPIPDLHIGMQDAASEPTSQSFASSRGAKLAKRDTHRHSTFVH